MYVKILKIISKFDNDNNKKKNTSSASRFTNVRDNLETRKDMFVGATIEQSLCHKGNYSEGLNATGQQKACFRYNNRSYVILK